MNDSIKGLITQIKLGKVQEHRNMIVIPIFAQLNSALDYVTLSEAIKKGEIDIIEKSMEGTVQQIKAINKGAEKILILDGEELLGAKQNRMLSTSVLLKGDSETIVPVSCTESGRWSYIREKFEDSEVIAHSMLRSINSASVHYNLNSTGSFASIQSKVWDEIDELSKKVGVRSSTNAMHVSYKSTKKSIKSYTDYFKKLNDQKGLLVLIDDKVIGMDYISSEKAYQLLHDKLIASYAMDAFLKARVLRNSNPIKKAYNFLSSIKTMSEEEFKSPGIGWDHRFSGEDFIGNALVSENEVIHLSAHTVKKS